MSRWLNEPRQGHAPETLSQLKGNGEEGGSEEANEVEESPRDYLGFPDMHWLHITVDASSTHLNQG